MASSDPNSNSESSTPRPQVPPSRVSTPRHAPAQPSGLRNAIAAGTSPEDRKMAPDGSANERMDALPEIESDGIHPTTADAASVNTNGEDEEAPVPGITRAESGIKPDVRTRLLGQAARDEQAGQRAGKPFSYGARPWLPSYGSVDSFMSGDGFGGLHAGENVSVNGSTVQQNGTAKKMSVTQWLAKRHGVQNSWMMYLLYYLPFTNWIRQYRWRYLQGDLIAALTMASFYIPMSLSYASNLAHIPPIHGLYSFVFNPFVYALLGTCPQMVVGPEAAGSLLTGQVVRENINRGKHGEMEGDKNAQLAGMVTGLAGAVILIAGLCRLGFLDSVLSRPFLRGFISAIGIVILVDQLIPEMGLDALAKHSGSAHGSSMDKILFLCRHGYQAHKLTCLVSFGAFVIVMVCREIKRRLQPRASWVAYIPDRFVVVVLSAVLAWKNDWDKKGLEVLGDIRAVGTPFKAHFPFKPSMIEHATDAFSTAFLIALLGFFESSVAAKSLGKGTGKVEKKKNDKGETVEESDGIRDMTVSTNRELVALGVANILGGLFMSLPAFGGYGRSKVNASTGGKTPMSSVFLSIITVFCILFLLPYFYYIPKGVLSAMISVVAYSLIEEAPHDIHFFWRISGYSELILMILIFLTTFFWNLRIGIAVGIGLSLLRLLRHSTRPRIQILGRVPGTHNDFDNAEFSPGGLEFIPHCLIVKIPEPLTFANTGSLKDRLSRLENHGTNAAHPALPRVRSEEHNQNIIFDVHGVTSMDPAAAQVLHEIVSGYRASGVRVFFCRLPGRKTEVSRLMEVTGIMESIGGPSHFVRSVQEALDLTELEDRMEWEPANGEVTGDDGTDENSPLLRRRGTEGV